jgi:hypothetical protein
MKEDWVKKSRPINNSPLPVGAKGLISYPLVRAERVGGSHSGLLLLELAFRLAWKAGPGLAGIPIYQKYGCCRYECGKKCFCWKPPAWLSCFSHSIYLYLFNY